ncbi:uncharacterized protein LOC142229435 [Haematobia irritans]|uniref:uncharacterized protein LOC142229435 n=1 Tax=Haematobia irritans TaxID=7368 RepID=UPI003F4F9FCF
MKFQIALICITLVSSITATPNSYSTLFANFGTILDAKNRFLQTLASILMAPFRLAEHQSKELLGIYDARDHYYIMRDPQKPLVQESKSIMKDYLRQQIPVPSPSSVPQNSQYFEPNLQKPVETIENQAKSNDNPIPK